MGMGAVIYKLRAGGSPTQSEGVTVKCVRELEVENECLKWLNKGEWFAWKNATVGVWDGKAGSYRKPSRYQIRGVSDIIAISRKCGTVLFIEVKAARGRQSKYQKAFENTITQCGGNYILVRSLEELKERLG